MKELSLHVLDIAQNAIQAGAARLTIRLTLETRLLTITIEDDGCGMSEAFLKDVCDPFSTTRTTRQVGMGLPLYKLAAEQAGGSFDIQSRQGEDHGTVVKAAFDTANIDCPPLGDMAETVVTILQGNPELSLVYEYSDETGAKRLSTDEMRQILGDVPLNEPEVLIWAREFLCE